MKCLTSQLHNAYSASHAVEIDNSKLCCMEEIATDIKCRN